MYEIEEITAAIKKIKVSKVVNIFKSVPLKNFCRPSGKVHVLIGLDWCQLMPVIVEQVGNLQLMRNLSVIQFEGVIQL